MNLASGRIFARPFVRAVAVLAVALVWAVPAMAQNKKGAYEVFIYFGGFYANNIPSAVQYGRITATRVVPEFAQNPQDPTQVYTPNLGLVGGDQSGDPNYPFNNGPSAINGSTPCFFDNSPPDPNNPNDIRVPYFDECDNDQESRYIYNASGIKTNGEIQRDDSEFMLGLRAGYNFTRHWEVEVDIGFGKQRIDLTRNVVPLLKASINDLSDPLASDLAKFYQFTWANSDYGSIVPENASNEHPNVVASRVANDPNYTIPMYFPVRNDVSGYVVPDGETFADVTGFVNRIFQDPTAFRNRGNQINIDTFTLSASVSYNFNTKPDSRIIPYVSGGFGRWFRNFDSPYDGNDTDYLSYGAGIRFFVNEIFAFRADARAVRYMDDVFTIKAKLHNYDLPDRSWEGFANFCARDQKEIRPPCQSGSVFDPSAAFPNLNGGGGNADISIEAELDDFYEVRIGFDVMLGGK